MKKTVNLEKLESFRDIISGKMNISEWAKLNDTTKQNASMTFKTFLNKSYSNDSFIAFEKKFMTDENVIVEINVKKENKDILDLFLYKHKANILDIGDRIFYSSIDKQSLNLIIKETLSNMGTVDIEKAFLANNIKADASFITLYGEKSVFSNFKVSPLSIIEGILKEHGKPMDSKKAVALAISYGISQKTAENILRKRTNNMNKIISLVDEVCDRDVFFNSYIDEDYKHKLIIAAGAVCEKNDVCSTDMKWIKHQIELNYPDIDTNKYSLPEMKAIICTEPQFQAGIRLNVNYLDKQCQFAPSSATELVENILEHYVLPISVSFIGRKIEESGKVYSQTTLTSIIMPKNPEFTKIDGAGWILTKNTDYVTSLIEKLKNISRDDFWGQIKKQFGVVTLNDLAKKLEVGINTLYVLYYKSEHPETFITRMNENGWETKIVEGKAHLIKHKGYSK